MSGAAAYRGQPLLVLGALLVGWCALRLALWQPIFDGALLVAPQVFEHDAGGGSRSFASLDRPVPYFAERSVISSRSPVGAPLLAAGRGSMSRAVFLASVAPVGEIAAQRDLTRVAIGHALLLAAGLAQMDLPPMLAAYLGGGAPELPGIPAAAPASPGLPQRAALSSGMRISGDAWLMARQDTASSVVSGRPSYGRSQAGAVLRYRLWPTSAHAPQAYVRASSALGGPLERDLAAGLSGRLVPAVPVRLAAEVRLSEAGAGTELRPAVIAISELAPVVLPFGARGEAYVQAGYVGGRVATAFVDGQGQIARTVGRFGEAEVTAGAGAWGGAQKGAARLDVGPTAAVSFRLGDARGRVAADYRFRVAGDAEPQSGPALTLSAGF